jgi:hypothetical protein
LWLCHCERDEKMRCGATLPDYRRRGKPRELPPPSALFGYRAADGFRLGEKIVIGHAGDETNTARLPSLSAKMV